MRPVRSLLLASAFLAITAPARAEAPPGFLLMWGSFGNKGPYEFIELRSVAAEPGGTVLAVDLNGLRRYTSDGVFVQLLATAGGGNTLPGPRDIAVAPTGEIYVLEQGALAIEQVVKLSSSGAQITQWGGHGSGPGQFDLPDGIATDAAGQVYVADTGNHRIQVFSPGGGFVTQWGTQDPADHAPLDLVVAGGVAYVVCGNPGRVEMYSASGHSSANGRSRFPTRGACPNRSASRWTRPARSTLATT